MTLKAITANDLIDGLVVYLNGEGEWVEDIHQARLIGEDDDLAAFEAEANNEENAVLVVGPYVIDVSVSDDGRVTADRYREILRAIGPSIHPEFAREDAPEHFEHPDGVEPVRFNDA